MYHTVNAREDIDEGAEVLDTDNLALVDAANFRLLGQAPDPVERLFD